MIKLSDSKGFGLLGVLAALIVIIAIAISGWSVYNHDHNKPASNVTSKVTSSSKNTPPSTTPNSTQEYMYISQWGVKVPLSGQISDLYYVASTSSQDSNGQTNTISLGLKSIPDANCSPTASNEGNTALAAILRTSPDDTDPVSGQAYTAKYPNGVTVGDYYYSLDEGGILYSKCASQSRLDSIDASLKTAVKNIVAN